MSVAKYERLRRSFLLRAKWFSELIDLQRVTEAARNPGVADALETLSDALAASHKKAEELHQDKRVLKTADLAPDVAASIESELQLLQERIESHDAHFARQSRGLSPAVQHLLRERCSDLGVAPRSLFVSVGEPGNFACSEPTFEQVQEKVPGTQVGPDKRILSITVPRIEGEHALWLPVPVGHELAHFFLTHVPPSKLKEIEAAIETNDEIASVRLPAVLQEGVVGPLAHVGRKLNSQRLASEWLHELICDAYAVRVFGVAGYAALAEFLESVGNKESTGEHFTHPPSYFRCRLMRRWSSIAEAGMSHREVELLESLADLEEEEDDDLFDWAAPILELLAHKVEDIWEATGAWTDGEYYCESASREKVESLIQRIGVGIPPIESDLEQYALEPANAAEIVNAAWLALRDGPIRESWHQLSDEDFAITVDRLALKAIEDAHFLAAWNAAPDAPASDMRSESPTPATSTGVLASGALRSRLASRGGERIILTPRLADPVGRSSIDVRLGSKFIVFDRASHPVFDALAPESPDPRTMQHRVTRRWGEPFYLHPNQLVLASVLEYLVMPRDLSAQVVTRSSYGRLGLITATAVQVHPGYRGCLTLELVNLGEVPIAIVPGQRIAQLMFFATEGGFPAEGVSKYDCPVGPEFSKVKEDTEAGVLQYLRSNS